MIPRKFNFVSYNLFLGMAEYNVGNTQVAKTVEQCYWDFFHKNLTCRLPWSKFLNFF